MVKIFISYAREDINSAMRLYNELSIVDGISPWLDKECLAPGSIWKIEIKKALLESKYILILLSENSTEKRGYVQKEIREAIEILDEIPENQPFLIPIRLKDVQPHFEKLNEIQFVDFFPSWNEGFNKVTNFIKKDIGSPEKSKIPKMNPIKFIKHDVKSLILIIALIALAGLSAWLYATSIDKSPDFTKYNLTKKIPFDTGWIFVGYFNYDKNVYIEGPFASIVFSPVNQLSYSHVPEIGDVLNVTKPRKIVIAKYKNLGLKHKLISPPLVKEILTDEDYTGIVLEVGDLVVVRDVEISASYGRTPSIWCRVIECDNYTESCKKALRILGNPL